MHKEQFLSIAKEYFPSEALDFAWFYFEQNGFTFTVTNSRKTKKGDFKYFRDKNKQPGISINGDLCSYDFLIVFVHELAHYMVYRHGNIFKMQAHGKEWRCFFRKLLENLIATVDLPKDIKEAFQNHSLNIKSSTVSDQQLETVLDRYRKKPEGVVYLKELSVGDYFICRGKLFKIDTFARTRVRCTLAESNRKYLISSMMYVTPYHPK